MKYIPIVAMLLALAGCDKGWDDKNKEKLPGERIRVLPHAATLPSASSVAKLQLGTSVKNAAWHSVASGVQTGNPELSMKLAQKFVINLHAITGDFGFVTTPIVADNAIFALDTNGELKAFDWSTGKEKWRNTEMLSSSHVSFFDTKYYAGGLLFHNNVIFATSGSSDVIAVDAATGKTKWKHSISGITRAVPVVQGSDVLIQTLEGSIYALALADGKISWLYMGNSEAISVISTVYPQIHSQKLFVQTGGQGVVVYDMKERGETGMVMLADIVGREPLDGADEVAYTPAKIGAVLYAYGKSSIAALDTNSGSQVWKKQMYVVAPLAISGNAIFALINDAGAYNLIAIQRNNGDIAWKRNISSELLAGRQVDIGMPFVAGGMVGLTAGDGMLYWFDPVTGKNIGDMKIPSGVYASNPVVVAGSLLLTSSNGTITRYDGVAK
ncbi:MAG: PQQ-binding-like beta-propeller repeat protein [Proteobacteria bacterium]|nr:PQQ-binding-like beta-propeller repeat protein [Pseudomonadota bacterium]